MFLYHKMALCLHCAKTPASFREAGSPKNVYCDHLCQALAYIGVKRPRQNEVEDMLNVLKTLKTQKTFFAENALSEIQKELNEYLVKAVIKGWVGAVKDLTFNRGMDPNTRDSKHRTLLMLAYFYSKSPSNESMTELLLKHPDTDPNLRDDSGSSILHTFRTYSGSSILHMTPGANLRLLEMIIRDKRTDINIQNKNDKATILRLACIYAKEDNLEGIIEILLNDNRINVNIQDSDGDTPLHGAVDWAGDSGSDRAVSLLLKHPDIDLNVQNNDLDTPLHVAAFSRKSTERSLEMLLRHPRTNIYLKDKKGKTAYDLTHNRVQRLLFRAYSLSKNSQLSYNQSKFIAARELQRKICTYLDDTTPADLIKLADVLDIPRTMTAGKSKDELCLIVSDVIAAGGIWDMNRYEETQALRRKAMTNFAKGALLKPLKQVKEEIREYFGISTLDQMSAAQIWAIIEKFRKLTLPLFFLV